MTERGSKKHMNELEVDDLRRQMHGIQGRLKTLLNEVDDLAQRLDDRSYRGRRPTISAEIRAEAQASLREKGPPRRGR